MASSARIDELRKKFDENPRRYFAPLANEYRKAGDLEQAIFICQEYLPQQPGHMSGHIVYGQALFELNRFDESRAVFETALSLDPENLIALRHLGDISRQMGDTRGARGWYQRVLEADPRNEEIAQIMMTLLATPAVAQAVIDNGATDLASADSTLSEQSDQFTAPTDPVGFRPSEMGFTVEKSEDRSDLAVGPELSALPERQPAPEAPRVEPAWTQRIPDDELLDLNDFSVGGIPLSELGATPSIDEPPAPVDAAREEAAPEFAAHTDPFATEAFRAEPAGSTDAGEVAAAASSSDDSIDIEKDEPPFEADPYAIAAAPRLPDDLGEQVPNVGWSDEPTPAAAESPEGHVLGLETFEHGVKPPEEEAAALEFEAFFTAAPSEPPAPIDVVMSEPAPVEETPEPEPVADFGPSEFVSFVEVNVAEPESVSELGTVEPEPVADFGASELEPITEFAAREPEPVADLGAMEPAPVAELGATEPVAEFAALEPEAVAEFVAPELETVAEFIMPEPQPASDVVELLVTEEPRLIDFATPVAPFAAVEPELPVETFAPEPEPEPISMAWDVSPPSPVESQPEEAAVPEAFVTETMAELYLQQGHLEAASDIYQKLVEQRPHDWQLRDRLRVIEEQIHRAPTPTVAADAIEPAAPEILTPVVAGPTIREFLAGLVTPRALPTPMETATVPYDGTPAPGDEETWIDYDATPISSPALSVEDTPDNALASIEEEFGEPYVPSPEPQHTPAHDALAIPVVDAAIDAIVDFGDTPLSELTPEPESIIRTNDVPPVASRGTPASPDETVRGSIDALFSGAGSSSSNEGTAPSTLAQAFQSDGSEATPLQGTPAHKAASELSLDHVFKTGQARRSDAETDGFSFDQFFADDLAEGASKSGNTPPSTQGQGADDIAQFNNWLNGLKKT